MHVLLYRVTQRKGTFKKKIIITQPKTIEVKKKKVIGTTNISDLMIKNDIV